MKTRWSEKAEKKRQGGRKKWQIEAAKQAEQNKLASERRQLLQSRLDELHANLKKENQTIEKMNPYLDSQWNSYSDHNFFTGTSLLVHSKNRKQDLEKEIFNVKMLLLKD